MLVAFLLLHAGILLIILANVRYLYRKRALENTSPLPSLTVLIPARNEESNLRRLLPSLVAQDYPEWNAVVVDDGSDDGTWDVIQHFADSRVSGLRRDGPPPGWVGKVHALYEASRHVEGDVLLFLDADAELLGPGALRRLAARYGALPEDAVLTGLTRLQGGGKLLVSLVPNAILSGLPWPLVRPLRTKTLGALNGQCWMIDADAYRDLEPHEYVKNEVLEDVMIGRYLKAQGLTPTLVDVQSEVAIHMYESFGAAWRGFRKNAYLILGGHPLSLIALAGLYFFAFVLPPFFSLWLLGSLFVLKATTDRLAHFPLWVTLCAPLSYVLGTLLQFDSAVSHWTGRVSWKGRRVGRRREPTELTERSYS